MYYMARFVAEGGLISYAANFPDLARRSAAYADKIFRARNPVTCRSSSDLTINLKTAQVLGLVVPQSLLIRATEVID